MKSRAFILVALLCVLFLFVSSTMAADTPKDETKEDKAKGPEQYGGRCRYGCCGGWGRYGCRRCCKTADEAEATEVNVETNENKAKEPEQYGGRCRYGCCGGWGRYGCRRCCKTADEAETEVNVDIHGRGGGGGGHCRYGCCGGYGSYCRCCYNPEEAHAYMQIEN